MTLEAYPLVGDHHSIRNGQQVHIGRDPRIGGLDAPTLSYHLI